MTYNILLFSRLFIIFVGQMLKWSQEGQQVQNTYSYTSIILCKFLMRCIFYLLLFKMKILSKVLEQGIELEILQTIGRKSQIVIIQNEQIKELTKRLLNLYIIYVFSGLGICTLRFILGPYDGEDQLTMTIIMGLWYLINLLLSAYFVCFFYTASTRFLEIFNMNFDTYFKIGRVVIFIVSVVLFTANFDQYFNTYLLQLNCGYLKNTKVDRLIENNQKVTAWFNVLDPLVEGLYMLLLIYYIINSSPHDQISRQDTEPSQFARIQSSSQQNSPITQHSINAIDESNFKSSFACPNDSVRVLMLVAVVNESVAHTQLHSFSTFGNLRKS